MKKTLGILLAVCFVLSVTAAAASAGASDYRDNDKKVDDHKDKKDYKDKKVDKKDKKDKKAKKVWMKGHSQKKKVPHYQRMKIGMRYIQIVIYKIIMVWIPGNWCWF
jgi:Ni/Co efflux regulator RcnB